MDILGMSEMWILLELDEINFESIWRTTMKELKELIDKIKDLHELNSIIKKIWVQYRKLTNEIIKSLKIMLIEKKEKLTKSEANEIGTIINYL